MVYGPITARRKLPEQNFETILLVADRFDRASQAQAIWAEQAKLCVEFVEGQQWSAQDLKTLDEEGRPGLTFNKVGPLVRLVMGYHRNNRTDEKYLPSHDDASTAQVADALTKTAKQISETSQQPYIDAEVFADGIMTGRGYYDWRLDFEDNELGEAMCGANDPFSTYLDPDGDEYDINKSSYFFTSRWASLNDIGATYGEQARNVTEPLLSGGAFTGMPGVMSEYAEEITPWRKFGGDEENFLSSGFGPMQSFLHHLIDQSRRSIRVLEMQHYVRTPTRVIVDLETGIKKHLPDHWKQDKIVRFLTWQEDKFAALGRVSPMRYDERNERRVRWTTMVGDVMVWDDWSPYQSFTLIPYFPYFRRGKTRGMVEDLLDPQREINKRRSSQIDAVTRTANAGWLVHENALDDEQAENWENNSAAPGFIGKWKGESYHKPDRITQAAPPLAAERLEQRATDDLRDISGINESLLGQDGKVHSGRAIEARQRQGVLSIQTYMDNMSRTRELVGRKKLELIQNHYTEARLIRTLSEDGTQQQIVINELDLAGRVLNNVSIGKYSLSIDETPLSASFIAAQFEELMEMVEKGVLPVEVIMDVAVEVSSIPQKESIKARLRTYMASLGIDPDGGGGTMPGSQPAAPGAAPAGGAPTNVVPMPRSGAA